MSLRHLKKVFASDDLPPPANESSSDEEGSSVVASRPGRKSSKKSAVQSGANKFALLAEMMGTNPEHEEESNAENEDENFDGALSEEHSSRKINRKKQRKKKKKSPIHDSQKADSENEPGCSSSTSMPQMDHRNTLEAKQNMPDVEIEISAEEREEIARKLLYDSLFTLDPKLLNPENELRKMFGSKVLRLEKSGSKYQSVNQHGQHRRNLLSRRPRLVYPKELRTLNGYMGITLELLSSDERTGYKVFKFNHNQSYRDIQKQFFAAVNTLNPDSIVNLMRSHPHHIDAHIQLSDIAKHSEDIQVASALVEDGIGYLQNVLERQFDVCSPCNQLPYKYQENRAMHILLFKYLVFLGQRGCPSTALQLAKKLLSLDPADPLGVTLMIDFYALKSKEFDWLCDIYDLWNPDRNLNQLPNWAYSTALAYFLKSKETLDSKQQTKSKNYKSSASAKREDLEAKSNELLQYALFMFPSVLLPLMEKCGVQTDSKVINHWYFNSLVAKKQTKPLNLLCDLYVWRTHHLWRDVSILHWLESNTQVVITQIDQDKKKTTDYAQKRQRRYAGTPYNILRHVILTDSKDITIPLPQELSKKPVLSFDPIPPRDAVDIYKYHDPQPLRPPSPGVPVRQGLWSMMMRSMLLFDLDAGQVRVLGDRDQNPNPPVADQQVADQQVPEVDGAEVVNVEGAVAGGPNNERNLGFQESVNTLLSAMRDLLQVATPAGVGAEEQNSSDSEEDQQHEER